jgi:Skp family chaperone for outer membrane proteins
MIPYKYWRCMMKRFTFLFALAAVIVAAACFAGSLYSQEEKEAPPVEKIGVVDLLKVSNKFDKWQRMEKQLNDDESKMKLKSELLGAEIINLQKYLETLVEGTKEHTKTQVQLVEKKAEFKNYSENEGKRLTKLAEKSMRELLDNILEVVAQYGRDNGYSLIIKESAWSTEGKGWQDLQRMVGYNTVMYSAQGNDLTEKIIWILNKRFK